MPRLPHEDFDPTPEQEEIYEAALSGTDHLILRARAGAAKSSTLVGINHRLVVPTLSVAFNKRIADEMKLKVPSHVEAKTTHSVGNAALYAFTGKRGKIDAQKRTALLRDYIDAQDPEAREHLREYFNDVRAAIQYGAEAGYVPTGKHPAAKRLLDDDDLAERIASAYDFEPSGIEMDCIRAVSLRAIDEVFNGWIDFSDMILIPTLWPASFRPFPLTMVDEAQDLSLLQHVMLRKMVGRKGRLIAVGDEYQSIYGFRGAHEDSMDKLARDFEMTTKFLTVSFRCPRLVADHVRWRAPDIQSPSWAKPGEILTLDSWSAEDIPDGAAIICRNNAPLFTAALRLLRAGRRPRLVGNDIVKNLIKEMKSLSRDMKLPQEAALLALDKWRDKMLSRYKNSPRIHDKYECIRLFIEEAETLGVAIAKAEHIDNMTGSIDVLTGHKSKGLEYEDVFFLDQHLIDPERDPQANNLRYVICTRAKSRLVYVTTETWQDEPQTP